MKAVVFDIDGTLIESMAIDTELYVSSINEVLGAVKFRASLSDYDNVTDSGILAQLIDDNGLSVEPDAVDRIQTLFVGRLSEHIQTVGPFPKIDGAAEIIGRLGQSTETRIAIATGGWRKSALIKLESSGFNLEGIPLATCDDSPSRTEIMRSALAMLGDHFESVTYIGDAEWDQRACDHLGWNFVAVGADLGGIDSYKHLDLQARTTAASGRKQPLGS